MKCDICIGGKLYIDPDDDGFKCGYCNGTGKIPFWSNIVIKIKWYFIDIYLRLIKKVM